MRIFKGFEKKMLELKSGSTFFNSAGTDLINNSVLLCLIHFSLPFDK